MHACPSDRVYKVLKHERLYDTVVMFSTLWDETPSMTWILFPAAEYSRRASADRGGGGWRGHVRRGSCPRRSKAARQSQLHVPAPPTFTKRGLAATAASVDHRDRCVCACVRVRACVRACVVRACVRVLCVCVCVCVCACSPFALVHNG